jgi:1-acyl-sn-glycerol-3-phosphate acyltransferase
MAVTTYARPIPKPKPHEWQTQPWARAVRIAGRRWVMSRYVDRYCHPLDVEGADYLREVRGPALIIANHSSHFDTPVVLSTLPARLRAKTAVAAASDKFYRPGKRGWWFSLFWNAYPIERGGGRDALAYSSSLLSRGWSVLLYPEGTRSRSGAIGELRHGAAILAMSTGVPVVPIFTEGLRNVMPKGERVPRPAAVRVQIGEPISLDGIASVEAGTARLQGALHALSLSSTSSLFESKDAAEAMTGVR